MVFPSMDNGHVLSIWGKQFLFATWRRDRTIPGKRVSGRLGVLSGTVYPSKSKKVPDVK